MKKKKGDYEAAIGQKLESETNQVNTKAHILLSEPNQIEIRAPVRNLLLYRYKSQIYKRKIVELKKRPHFVRSANRKIQVPSGSNSGFRPFGWNFEHATC